MKLRQKSGCGPRGCLLLALGALVGVWLLGAWLNHFPETNSPRDLSHYSTLEISDFSYVTAKELEAYKECGPGALAEIREQALTERFNGHIRLNGLTTLNAVTVLALNQYQPRADLSFGRVAIVDANVAELLARRNGDLYLDGLTEMTDAVARSLAQHRGKVLSLRGLKAVTPAQAGVLKKHAGKVLLSSERP